MHPADQARAFLSRVLPWDDYPTAWRNIHWSGPAQDTDSAKKFWGGAACHDLLTMRGCVAWASVPSRAKDVFVCMSLQNDALPELDVGKWKRVIRKSENAVALKSLWLEIDVKPGAFADLDAATRAVQIWRGIIGMPRATLVVLSGRGMHLHWVLEQAVTPEIWQPLAEALKASVIKHLPGKVDVGVISDRARLLRVPGTKNFKYPDTPNVVLVDNVVENDYSLEYITNILSPFIVTPGSNGGLNGHGHGYTSSAGQIPPRVNGGINGHAHPAAAIDTSEWDAGITTREKAPINLELVFPECAVLAQARDEHGASYGNELWHLIVLASTFAENGREWAHALSDGWDGYDSENVNRKYDEKLTARARSAKLGWPQCVQFSSLHPACAACAHLSEHKSPLNFLGPDTDLPPGYRRINGLVYQMGTNAEGHTTEHRVLPVGMHSGELEKHPVDGLKLHFTIVTYKGDHQRVSVPVSTVNGMDLATYLGRYVAINTTEVKTIRSFLVAWVNHLQSISSTTGKPAGFGWHLDATTGKLGGFALNGTLYQEEGVTMQATQPEATMQSLYAPHGDLSRWREAADFITSQGRHDLNVLVASGFAAPLVRLDDHQGLVLAAWSAGSGVGKTSALRVAQTIWGAPSGIFGLEDTSNMVLHKASIIRNLPCLWDELKTDEQLNKFSTVVFTMSGGREKGRLNSRIEMRATGEWQTMLVACNNQSLVEHISRQTESTDAGIYRVFEFEVAALASKTAPGVAHRILAQVGSHYGQAGEIYARFLAAHHAEIRAMLTKVKTSLEHEVGAEQNERYWISTITVLLVGAALATKLGLVQIDVLGMKNFLLGTLERMRARVVTSTVTMTSPTHVIDLLTQFLTSLGARHLLVTDHIVRGAGRPPRGFAVNIRQDTSKLISTRAQLALTDRILRFQESALKEWCQRSNRSAHTLIGAFRTELGAIVGPMALGAMTPYQLPGRGYCVQIDLSKQPASNILEGYAITDDVAIPPAGGLSEGLQPAP